MIQDELPVFTVRDSPMKVAALLVVLAFAVGPVSASNPHCWNEPRIYHPDGSYAEELKDAAMPHLRIERVAGELHADRVMSPNKAYAFTRTERSLAAGRTTATVRVFTESKDLLEVEARDVGNVVDVKWLNEKLLFLRVWLGRIGGVDLVVDVEQDKIALTQAVADGRLLWEQAQESCGIDAPIPACHEPCPKLK